jgi:hypothetical protein
MYVYYYVSPKNISWLLWTKLSQIPLSNPLSLNSHWDTASHRLYMLTVVWIWPRSYITTLPLEGIKPYCLWHVRDLWLVMPYHRSWRSGRQVAMRSEYDTAVGLLGCNGRYLQMLRRNLLPHFVRRRTEQQEENFTPSCTNSHHHAVCLYCFIFQFTVSSRFRKVIK